MEGIGSLGEPVDPNVLKRWLAMMDQPSDATTWAQRAPEGDRSPSFMDTAMAATKMPKDALRKLIFSSITPFGYYGHEDEISSVMDAILSGDPASANRREGLATQRGLAVPHGRESILSSVEEGRDDLWATYLGLPQKHGTLIPSEYRPTQARDEDAEYSSLSPELAERLISSTLPQWTDDSIRSNRALEALVREIREVGGNKVFNDWDTALLGDFTMSEGSDEKGPYVSYYDKWDLDQKMARGLASLTGIGKNPPEIYGRSYYDPETFEMIGSSR